MDIDVNTGMFPNGFMLVTLLVGAFIIMYLLYAERDKFSWTTALWLIPITWLVLFYFILTFNIEPIASDPRLRVALYRPGFWFLFAFVILDKLNGRVNTFIDTVVQGAKCFLASTRRRL